VGMCKEKARADRGRESGKARNAFVEAALTASGTFGPAPDAADLALIDGRYALAPRLAEELCVRRIVPANDALDRSYERFAPVVQEWLAVMVPPIVCRRPAAWPGYCQGCRITLPQWPVI